MTPAPPTSAREEVRRLWSLAWPVVLTSLNWTVLQVTDIVILGAVSTEEAAAFGASRALTFVTIVAAVGSLTGVLVYVSRADGAKDLRETGRILHQGIALALLQGAVMSVPMFAFAQPALSGLGVAPAIAPAAADVVRVLAIALPFQLLLIAASYFLEGVSRPSRVTVVNLATMPINALLSWMLATGAGGLPALGAVGAAWGSTITSMFGAVLMLAAAWRLPRARERGVHDLSELFTRQTLAGAVRLLRFGLVPAIASALELAGFSILIALSTRVGDVTAHAFQIVFSVHNVTFAVALGLGSAAGVRAGNAVGEGLASDAGRRGGIAAALAAGAMLAASLLLIVGGGPLVDLFPASPEVKLLAAAMLAVWAPFILFDGVQVVMVYTLRSLGDQVMAGVNGIVAFFVVTGGLGWTLVAMGVGPMALVWASGIGMVAAAVLGAARLWVVVRRLR
jgi:MATE family multidrug resistance protein